MVTVAPPQFRKLVGAGRVRPSRVEIPFEYTPAREGLMADPQKDENPMEEHDPEEIDEQFLAILDGLRTTIPGVMVLFTFLLVLPLQASFGDLSGARSVAYYLAFATAALASILLLAPGVHQRFRAPITGIKRRSWHHVMFAIKLTLAGTVALSLSIVAVVFLVTSLVFGDWAGAGAAVIAAAVCGWSWFYVPLVTFANER
jgi:hypothetical protein